ncbi:MAG: sigma 54-interacting transcriptional regulator [Lachnospiraceae bacterium]
MKFIHFFFFSQQKKAYSTPKNELQIFSQEAADIFLSHYLGFSTEGYVSNQSLEKIIHSSLPVMIFGESGVGKQQIAATLYTQGCYQNNPYIIVDFEFSTEKTWNFLFAR